MARSRNKKTEIEEEIEKRIPTTRYKPDYKVGLTAQQVQEHRLHGWSKQGSRSSVEDNERDCT